MTKRRIGVLGIMAGNPYAGMAWMHLQFLLGLQRLGHDVFYIETTHAWPYDPLKQTSSQDHSYAVEFLRDVMTRAGIGDRWAYRAAYADGQWYGPLGPNAQELLRTADAVLNISGSTQSCELEVPCNLVYIGTDPVIPELKIAKGDNELLKHIADHSAHFTYGENIGTADCPIPPLPFSVHPMRQPVILDIWSGSQPARRDFTTVANWSVDLYDIEFEGELYLWSKHHEYLKIIDLPRRTSATLEIAMGLSGLSDDVTRLLQENRWKVVDAYYMSLDPWRYRDYIRGSGAEFSVAKDMVVRLRSGWFSERSACYLAAGRPVITQDTGFSRHLPTGRGLFAFQTVDDILVAIDAINSDYEGHSRAAYEIARDYFQAEIVLGGVLESLNL